MRALFNQKLFQIWRVILYQIKYITNLINKLYIMHVRNHDSPQWYDIVHFKHKLSWLCFGLSKRRLCFGLSKRRSYEWRCITFIYKPMIIPSVYDSAHCTCQFWYEFVALFNELWFGCIWERKRKKVENGFSFPVLPDSEPNFCSLWFHGGATGKHHLRPPHPRYQSNISTKNMEEPWFGILHSFKTRKNSTIYFLLLIKVIIKKKKKKKKKKKTNGERRQVHGVLNIIGWGTLIPIGIVIARYFREEFPLKCDRWYSAHAVCQTCGYIMGTVGWGFGVSLINSSNRSHVPFLVLGILVILLTAIQVSFPTNSKLDYKLTIVY